LLSFFPTVNFVSSQAKHAITSSPSTLIPEKYAKREEKRWAWIYEIVREEREKRERARLKKNEKNSSSSSFALNAKQRAPFTPTFALNEYLMIQ
jgi:hypothetical protein